MLSHKAIILSRISPKNRLIADILVRYRKKILFKRLPLSLLFQKKRQKGWRTGLETKKRTKKVIVLSLLLSLTVGSSAFAWFGFHGGPVFDASRFAKQTAQLKQFKEQIAKIQEQIKQATQILNIHEQINAAIPKELLDLIAEAKTTKAVMDEAKGYVKGIPTYTAKSVEDSKTALKTIYGTQGLDGFNSTASQMQSDAYQSIYMIHQHTNQENAKRLDLIKEVQEKGSDLKGERDNWQVSNELSILALENRLASMEAEAATLSAKYQENSLEKAQQAQSEVTKAATTQLPLSQKETEKYKDTGLVQSRKPIGLQKFHE